MAPLARALRQLPQIDLHICVTGQHREMLHQVLETFELEVEQDLAVMTRGQTLNGLTEQLLVRLDQAYGAFQPDLVLVHGDTSTSFVARIQVPRTIQPLHRLVPLRQRADLPSDICKVHVNYQR